MGSKRGEVRNWGREGVRGDVWDGQQEGRRWDAARRKGAGGEDRGMSGEWDGQQEGRGKRGVGGGEGV